MNREDKLVLEWFERARPLVGEKLPPERTLAEMLGLSRAALRKGLAALEARGLLLRQVGRGTFVQGAAAGGGAGFRSSRTDGMAPLDASPRQALTARLALEPALARLAAREATRAHLMAIEVAETSVAEAADWVTFDAADATFHRSIAQATGNPILLRLFDETMAAARDVIWGALLQRDDQASPAIAALQDHAAIGAAILARDVGAAGAAMRRHLLAEAKLVSFLV